VTKLNASGTALVYSTYLGGSGGDYGSGIALDAGGNAYVSGYTSSGNFPTTPGAFQRVLNGSFNIFVTKLKPDGTLPPNQQLLYSTYLGGSGSDFVGTVAVDAAGNAYLTGYTNSSNPTTGFPTTPGAYQRQFGAKSNGAQYDVFVAELNPNISGPTSLVYSTFLGGHGDDQGYGIAVDAIGNAYVTGQTGWASRSRSRPPWPRPSRQATRSTSTTPAPRCSAPSPLPPTAPRPSSPPGRCRWASTGSPPSSTATAASTRPPPTR
jgi:hypothetical protein